MKLFAVFALVFVLVGAVAANKDEKKDKDQWREKKEKHQQSLILKKHVGRMEDNKMEYKGNIDYDPIEYKGETNTHKLKHYFGKKKFYKKAKKHGAKKMKKAKKAMSWLDIRADIDCDLKCKPGEVCISGPVVTKPICVHKKDLKKSMKMFHRYHRKEMKEWRKYQKKYYKSDWKLKEEKYGKMSKQELAAMKKEKYEKMSKHEKAAMKKEKYEKMSKHELAAMKKEKRDKLGKKYHHFDKKFHKKGKFHKGKFHKGNFHYKSHPKSKPVVCGGNEMAQMKTRMMGWFHLLHGQDHEARKAHGGSIAKFYKHVSVKKELREYNGEKCQCMKSAMWQFHQMDKNHDDHLTNTELTMLEENSLEVCMRPYLESCDRSGDKKISSDEWCCCFTNTLPPCYKAVNEIRKSGKPVTYMPRCDKEGYYMHEQCKGDDSEGTLTCWCVDYNGNEYRDTVKQGRAHCHKIEKYAYKKEVPLA